MATKTLTFSDGGTLHVEYDGAERGSVTLSADANELDDRTAVVTLVSDYDGRTARIDVTQKGQYDRYCSGNDGLDVVSGTVTGSLLAVGGRLIRTAGKTLATALRSGYSVKTYEPFYTRKMNDE